MGAGGMTPSSIQLRIASTPAVQPLRQLADLHHGPVSDRRGPGGLELWLGREVFHPEQVVHRVDLRQPPI
jgi:hypothetical protein